MMIVPEISPRYPLSPLQQGMLFHALHSPESGVDIEQIVLTLDHAIDPDILARAWQRLLSRHALLRTRFVWDGVDSPIQEVVDSPALPWRFENWTTLPAERRSAALTRFLAEDRLRGFSLAHAPLCRVACFVTGMQNAIVVWTFHHALLDGRCFAPLLSELFEHYDCVQSGRPSLLPEPPPYRDFIEWLENRPARASDAFFTNLLKGFRAPTPIGIDNLGDTSPLAGHGSRTSVVGGEIVERLNALAAKHGFTLNTILQGAWALLLSRYCGETDVVFGATRACRHGSVPRALNTIGPFINTLPVRVDTDPEQDLVSFLARLRAQHLAIRPHEHTPLSHVQALSEIPRGMPLFHTLVVYENQTLDDSLKALGGDWRLRHAELHEQTNFPITLAAYGKTTLTLKCDFDRARFSDDTIDRLLGHLTALLTEFVARPDDTLSTFSLLAPGERETLLLATPERATFDPHFLLHERFEARVAETPDATALVFGETRLTYADLDTRANRLAHALKRHGIGPETLAGLYGERSELLVIGILAILKAGGAYLPIDLAYPPERIAFMLQDTRAPVLLAPHADLARLNALDLPESVTLLALDDDYSQNSATRPDVSGVDSDSLAYVIFTSGSTGKPKGAQVTHRNVARLFTSTDNWFRFDNTDVWTLFHSHAFDFSVWEIWGALLYGGLLVVVPYVVSRAPDEFLSLLQTERVTVLNQTPSAFRQLVAADQALKSTGKLALRFVIFGGEALELASLKPWFRKHGDTAPQLVNMYGITETTVHVTYRPIRQSDLDAGRGSVIGEPIPDLGLYLLDQNGEPTPIGVPGEMFVSGAGLARGYLGRPELTVQRFVENPFSTDPDSKLYKTGDLARRVPGASGAPSDIEYLGRIDLQVKIRGFRIELGEIESALARLPKITGAVVLARDDNPGEKRLVAYLTHDGPAPEIPALRDGLQKRLPPYMVPSAFVFLPGFPLTTNGKIDKNALPAPETIAARAPRGLVESPRNPAEATLKTIWEDVLRQSEIGIFDSFFERGGDSILSIHILARARAAGLALTARQIFENPTIAAQAAVAKPTDTNRTPSEPDETRPDGEIEPTPILRFFDRQNFDDSDYYNQSFALTITKPVDDDTLRAALDLVVSRHDAFRLRKIGDRWTHALVAGPVPLATTDSPDDFAALCDGAQRGLSLQGGPVIRAARFQSEPGGDTLFLAIHHVAIDGVSWRIFLEDLDRACDSLGRGETPAFPKPTLSFAGWSKRLAAKSASGTPVAEIAPSAETVELPRLSPGISREADARTILVGLSEHETALLFSRVPTSLGTRANDALLTALSLAATPILPRGDWRIEVEGHGRDAISPDLADVSRTIGWFTTISPVRLPVGETDPLSALRAVKSRLRQSPDPRDASAPDATLLFNFLGQFDSVAAHLSHFALADAPVSTWRSPQNVRPHAVEILAWVRDNRLEIGVTFAEKLHAASRIESLANGFLAGLRALIALSESDSVDASVVADFPLAKHLPESLLSEIVAKAGGPLDDLYPLSAMQTLFFSMDPVAPALNFEAWRFVIEGRIDENALKTAWEKTVARHAVLRTSFVTDGSGDAWQAVRHRVEVPFETIDLRHLPIHEKNARVSQRVADERARHFILNEPPLLRLILAQTGDDTLELLWCTHHLLVDGWSWPLILRDVCEFYDASREDRAAALAPPKPYRNFIAWQKDNACRSESFWRETLAGAAPIEMRDSREKGEEERAKGDGADFPTSNTECPTPAEAAKRFSVTLNTLTQAAWALVLARHGGTRDVIFGASFSGRPDELLGALEIVGPFVNNLPVHVNIPDSGEIGAWLSALQTHLADIAQHADSSPVDIQNWSGLPPGRRLFDSLVVFQNYSGSGESFALGETARLHVADAPDRTAYALTVVAEPGESLHLKIDFDPAKVSAQTAYILQHDLSVALAGLAQSTPQTTPAALLNSLSPPRFLAAPNRFATAKASGPSPTGERERELVALFAEALGVESVGLDQNFFELGANSLLLVSVHAKLRQRLKLDLPIVALFQNPTVRRLARAIDPAAETETSATIATFKSAADERAQRQRDALRRLKGKG